MDEKATVTAKPAKKKWSLKKKILVIVGVVVLVFIALFTVINVATDAPLKVSTEFVSNIQSGDASKAYGLMSADAQTATSSQDFAAMVDTMSPILTGELKNTSKEVKAETGAVPSATIVYEVEGSDDFTHVLTVNLQQNDGEWQVLNFESVKK